MHIYGIEVRYIKGKCRPVLLSTPVRETKKGYIAEERMGFLGYRSHIAKTEKLSFSPRHAWEEYVLNCNRLRMSLREQSEQMAEFQQIGITNIQTLMEADC